MKQNLSLSLLFLLSASISRATILPIAKGDGIWNVATRIATELATITLGTPSCSFPIQQSDIGFGGTFVITASNAIYCLDENLTITFGPAIRIAGSGITLDLMGHIIDGQNFATTGIELAGGVKNITIKNGTIRRIGGFAPTNGTAIRDTINHTATLKNIVIKDMNFSNNNVAAIALVNAAVPTPDVDELLIENCRAFNSGFISVIGTSCLMEGCEIEEDRSSKAGGFTFNCPTIARSCVVQDCIMTASLGANVLQNSIFIINTENVIIRNCILQEARGILISAPGNISISDCVVRGATSFPLPNGLGGIYVSGPSPLERVVIERCNVSNCLFGINIETFSGGVVPSISITDCVAEQNSFFGFIILVADNISSLIARPISNVTFRRCCATRNGVGFGLVIGFSIPLLTIANLSQVVFEDCIAQDNFGDGFALLNQVPQAVIQNVVFRNCISQRNRGGTVAGFNSEYSATNFSGDGFGIGTGSTNVSPIRNVIFEDCTAQGNARDGFSFASTTSNMQAVNCFSMNNTGTGFNLKGNNNFAIGCMATGNRADFNGVSDPAQVIPYSTPGAINGIGRFVNVSS
jgi:hypothetical protein